MGLHGTSSLLEDRFLNLHRAVIHGLEYLIIVLVVKILLIIIINLWFSNKHDI